MDMCMCKHFHGEKEKRKDFGKKRHQFYTSRIYWRVNFYLCMHINLMPSDKIYGFSFLFKFKARIYLFSHLMLFQLFHFNIISWCQRLISYDKRPLQMSSAPKYTHLNFESISNKTENTSSWNKKWKHTFWCAPPAQPSHTAHAGGIKEHINHLNVIQWKWNMLTM